MISKIIITGNIKIETVLQALKSSEFLSNSKLLMIWSNSNETLLSLYTRLCFLL